MAGAKTQLREVAVTDLIPTPDNPRVIDAAARRTEEFRALVASVKGQGVQIPVLARPHPTEPGKFDLRYGARRHAAATEAGLETIPTLIEELTDEEAFERTFTENYARDDLSVMEEGRAVQVLMERLGGDAKAVADKLGRTVQWVRLRANLKRLAPRWKKLLGNGSRPAFCRDWSGGQFALIARLPAGTQTSVMDALTHYAPLTAKDLTQFLNENVQRVLRSARWDVEDATLVKKAGACSACTKRSSCQGRLFHETDEGVAKLDRCLDPVCWRRKYDAWLKRRHAELKREHPDLRCAVRSHDTYRELQDLRQRFGTVLSPYDEWKRCKKTAKGAAAVMIVTGANAGELQWALVGRRATAKRTGAGAGEKTPTPLKERRRALESKRWSAAIKRLADQVEKVPLEDLPLPPWATQSDKLLALAACFGTHRQFPTFGASYNEGGRMPGAPWSAAKKCDPHKLLAALEPNAARQALWAEQIRPLLVRRLHSNAGVTQTPPALIREAKATARLCGIDLTLLYAEACETYKEPKTWRRLKADGTPKVVKPARATRARKRKKAASRLDADPRRKGRGAEDVARRQNTRRPPARRPRAE